tara:strand:+ start:475 stop:729 length:255 start_codon:yes stop_codon:yes gene_type:complete
MLEKRSISISGHRTSIALEPEFWAVIDEAAREQKLSLAALIGRIDSARAEVNDQTGAGRNLASACRIFVLQCLQDRQSAATPDL